MIKLCSAFFALGLAAAVPAQLDISIGVRETGAGGGTFSFIGGAAFSGTPGELRAEFVGSHTFVSGDVDGDAGADLQFRVSGLVTLGNADFLL